MQTGVDVAPGVIPKAQNPEEETGGGRRGGGGESMPNVSIDHQTADLTSHPDMIIDILTKGRFVCSITKNGDS